MATQPVRYETTDFEMARLAGATHGRSTAAQLAHWVRIGRELEAAPSTTVRQVADVLTGVETYDDLDGTGQAIVRARWAEDLEARLADHDLRPVFEAAGHRHATLDADGSVVVHEPHTASAASIDRPTDRALAVLRDIVQAWAAAQPAA